MSGWFRGIRDLLRRSEVDESLWDELEELLIRGDVGPALADEMLTKLRERSRGGDLRSSEDVEQALRGELVGLLQGTGDRRQGTGASGERAGDRGQGRPPPVPLPQSLAARFGERAAPESAVLGPQSSLQLVLVVGVNGAGKTTSVAKLGNFWRKAGRHVLLAAADTFRAAGTEQLEIWAERAHLPCVRSQRGGDPGAVIFDALSAARARGMDLVVADTAGRLHTKTSLMEELGKLGRIATRREVPVHSLLVLDATTGQNGIAQARGFREAVGLSGIVLSKLDGTAKGGAVFSIVQEFSAPVLFGGTGERIDDLAEFDPDKFVAGLFGE